MPPAVPDCPACGTALPVAARAPGAPFPCPGCGAATDLLLFPALVRPPANTVPAAASLPGDATCFHHPDRVAIVACSSCGRFLCGLCDLDLGDRHTCATCLHAEHDGGGPAGRRVARFVQYDSLALALATIPILSVAFWFMSCLAAPAAAFLAIRFWRQPVSLLPRTKLRFVLALLITAATIVGWISILYVAVDGMLSGGTTPGAGAR